MTPQDTDYNFAYLDEQTKRMIRRAILKALAIPGYQVPFASREMPMPYGWGTGGVQVTAACLLPDDCLKVIDQGADDTTNAVSIRRFFQRTAGVETTEATSDRQRIAQHFTAANEALEKKYNELEALKKKLEEDENALQEKYDKLMAELKAALKDKREHRSREKH